VELHARGVLHADVHARNVMVGDKVALLDFGYSQIAGSRSRTGRAGMYYFYEPELIAAMREGVRLPPPTEAGEQYSIAALLYLLITGEHYLEFRYDRDEMRQQIENDPPVPFAQRGIPPWPEVERILFRALEKDPSRRHASVAELAALLANVRRESSNGSLTDKVQALLESTLRSFSRGGAVYASGFTKAPTASINFGCAGAAVALLQIAETRSDPSLLALADIWRSRAVARIGTEGAYYNEKGLKREVLGEVTPYHTESGIHAAAAMVAAAMGDVLALRHDIRRFLEASKKPCATIDLTLGRSGSLLASAMLLSICDGPAEAAALRAFGAETMHAIWSELDARPPLPESPPLTYHGIAHGWAGYFYAALRWCAASGDALPPRLVERLQEYASLKIAKGRGIYWENITGRNVEAMIPGWCNGSAGQVFLFTLAHRLLGDDQWLHLAEQSAWTVWDEPRHVAQLCCGTAGRAYALLNLYKHTGATEWLTRARELANHAAAFAGRTDRPNTLYRGELGVAVLIADLASPENARMPFFE
jgi:serine/threonine-protein kinase